MSITSWRARRLDHALDEAEAERVMWAWKEAADGAGLTRTTYTVTGPTTVTPSLTSIVLGPPLVLVVQLLAGQVVGDYREVAYRLAGALGGVGLGIERRGLQYVRLEVLTSDPLEGVLELPQTGSATTRLLLGRDESGRDIEVELADLPHVAIAGETRSGKTAAAYSLLVQVTRRPDVLVAGVDASGLLLRPFAGTRHAEHQAVGLADLQRVETVLSNLVAEMDARIGTLPADRDTLAPTVDVPFVIICLEEWPGTLRAADAAADTKLGKRLRSLMSRLVAESHKAAFRVVMLAQRMEAGIVGGAERAQLACRLSFRLDNPESVRMLHAAADLDFAARHAAAPDGVALLSMPGVRLKRIRAPWVGSYAAFVDAITTNTR